MGKEEKEGRRKGWGILQYLYKYSLAIKAVAAVKALELVDDLYKLSQLR